LDRTYANIDGGAVSESDPATISGFALDKYEVTVGRFRQFFTAWSKGWLPPPASGRQTHLNAGKGLTSGAASGQYESGWSASYDGNVAPTDANLECETSYSTWTSAPAAQENLPVNCVNWYEAYAFCIWDGGFLPSEAEWEYAAAGGAQQREWPWGSTAPGTANQYAIYGCNYPTTGSCTGLVNIAPVGTPPLGEGLWGQLDLAGNVAEWTLDLWTATYPDPCTDCADLTAGTVRVARGGTFALAASDMLPTYRGNDLPTVRDGHIGFRCARAP
jgi:formylglycine-generating enzyme required for sulfatase activity